MAKHTLSQVLHRSRVYPLSFRRTHHTTVVFRVPLREFGRVCRGVYCEATRDGFGADLGYQPMSELLEEQHRAGSRDRKEVY